MILTSLPDKPYHQLIEHLTTTTRHGNRNRCLYALRPNLRAKDIASLTLRDILDFDGSIRTFFIAEDGRRVRIPTSVRPELERYLRCEFETHDLRHLIRTEDPDTYLFETQQHSAFSPAAIRQTFHAIDRQLHLHFTAC
jgi:hypothetical protein